MNYIFGLLETQTGAVATDFEDVPAEMGALALVAAGPATLICGHGASHQIRAKRRNLLAHARVLETAARFGTVLPMRFGMTAECIESVSDRLRLQEHAVSGEFDRLSGQVEFGVRAAFPKQAVLAAMLSEEPALLHERDRLKARSTPDRMQTAEFGRRIAERLERRRWDAQHNMLSRLATVWRDHTVRVPDEDVQVLAADVLAPAADHDAMAAEIEAAAAASGFAPDAEPSVRIVGPMPPYSFVRLSLGMADEAAA
ncbi:MAG: GvpL/GvpF family gas vesicle protein [Pseudomonadota bacterium]